MDYIWVVNEAEYLWSYSGNPPRIIVVVWLLTGATRSTRLSELMGQGG